MSLENHAYLELSEAKDYLQLKDSTDDEALTRLVNSVSMKMDKYLERTIRQTTYTDQLLDGTGLPEIDVPNFPITTLTSVYEDDVLLTVDTHFYSYAVEGYLRKYGTAVWTSNPKGVKLTYVAGYVVDEIPADLKQACLEQVAYDFQKFKQSRWGEVQRTFGDGALTFETTTFIKSVLDVLKLYRKT